MNPENWNAEQYQKQLSFVTELGTQVFDLLAPQSNEIILDLGCGDGRLTSKISKHSKDVIGIDTSQDMINAAKKRGVNAILMNGDSISYKNTFDAVFSNAALHWMSNQRNVLKGVHNALKLGGRFAGEFGGNGNLRTITSAMKMTINQHPKYGEWKNTCVFPTKSEYKALLEEHGFKVSTIKLISRPTTLKTDISEFIKIFSKHLIRTIDERYESDFINDVINVIQPSLFTSETGWQLDYVRLRFLAYKVDLQQYF